MGLAVGAMVDLVVGALAGCLLVFHFPHELKCRHQLRLGIVGGGTGAYYLSRVASSPARTLYNAWPLEDNHFVVNWTILYFHRKIYP